MVPCILSGYFGYLWVYRRTEEGGTGDKIAMTVEIIKNFVMQIKTKPDGNCGPNMCL